MKRWIHVISDLHVGEGVLDDFDEDIERHLLAFLADLRGRAEPVELVISSDFMDFAQASPWRGDDLEDETADGIPLCFTEAQSVAKLNAILVAHAAVFDALGALIAAKPDNRIVLLPGNHDADLFWPAVQRRLMAAVAPAGRERQFVIHLERHYRPAGHEWLWIEHGHQFDPINAFSVAGEERWSTGLPPLYADRRGTLRLLECTGTRFLLRFLNRLDARYPYVDNVKPFSRFLKIFGASALTPGWAPLDAALAVTQMLAWLARTAATHPSDLLRVDDDEGAAAPHPLLDWLRQAPAAEVQHLQAALAGLGCKPGMPLDMALEREAEGGRVLDCLAAHPELLEGIGERDPALLGAAPGTLRLGAGFFADETAALRRGAASIVATHGVRAVVMGHTHEPVHDHGGHCYLNTGSWTRYMRFAPDQATQPWRVLRERSWSRFPYQLTSACVRPGSGLVEPRAWPEAAR